LEKLLRIKRLAWADVMIRLGQLAGVPWIFFTPVAPAFFYFKGGARRARRKAQDPFLFREKRKAQGLE
jgi:hypothetical protein